MAVRERAAGGYQCAAFAPAQHIFGRRLCQFGWIGERQDDRPRRVLAHAPDDSFGKRSGLTGRTDQYSGAESRHHTGQVTLRTIGETRLLS